MAREGSYASAPSVRQSFKTLRSVMFPTLLKSTAEQFPHSLKITFVLIVQYATTQTVVSQIEQAVYRVVREQSDRG